MGRQDMEERNFCSTLTVEERARMQPFKKARCVIMSGDSPSSLQASLPQVGYDMPDEGQLGKITPTTPPTPGTPTNLKALEADTEKIEEAVAFVQTTFPSPEPRPRIEKNGIDLEIGITTKPIEEPDNDACLVNCLYFAQQFCECTIL